jgi:alpha-tubulin suppressor-like RCC1 family protein
VGFLATCAVTSSGNVYCWGFNGGTSWGGELGNGITNGSSSTPVEVLGVGGTGFLSGVTAVSVGYSSACAVTSSGNVYCWGVNTYGQLGNGTSTGPDTCSNSGDGYACSPTPVAVTGLSGVAAVSAGEYFACAVTSSGNAYCWGDNASGQLGNNTTTEENTPVEVLGVGGTGFLSGVTAVSAGYSSACALLSGGTTVECWGDNGNGELGNGTTTSSSTPVAVTGLGL